MGLNKSAFQETCRKITEHSSKGTLSSEASYKKTISELVKKERKELSMITYIDIFEVNSKRRGLLYMTKVLSPISLKDDSCWTEFFWMIDTWATVL